MKKSAEILDNFIVLEGLDGSGTTTQLSLLEKRLESQGVRFSITAEPTKGRIGCLIRDILKGGTKVHQHTIAYLFAADRNEHLHDPENGILAQTGMGSIVVSDRYLFSSLAYQSVTADFDFVLSLNDDFPLPQHLFFLDTPVMVCMERLKERKAREIFEYAEFQEKVLAGYLKTLDYFKTSGMQIHMINGMQPPEKISAIIWDESKSLPIFKK